MLEKDNFRLARNTTRLLHRTKEFRSCEKNGVEKMNKNQIAVIFSFLVVFLIGFALGLYEGMAPERTDRGEYWANQYCKNLGYSIGEFDTITRDLSVALLTCRTWRGHELEKGMEITYRIGKPIEPYSNEEYHALVNGGFFEDLNTA